jgi:hypothetical protein
MLGLLHGTGNSAAAASSAAQQAVMQQPQQQPALLPHQLPPLPQQAAMQQQQVQPQLQLQALNIIPVKSLPLGMRVGGMSPQQRLQLRTELLNGRPERMQQLQLQQQQEATAAAVGEGEPAAKQPKTGLQDRHGRAINAAQPQQQQQQQQQQKQLLSVSQVEMLQASLRLQQHEMAPQQQHGSAPCIGLLAAAAAAAGCGAPQHVAMLGLPHAFGSSPAAAGSSDDNQTRVHRQMQELQHSRAAAATSARIHVSVPSLPGQAVLHDVALQQQQQCSDNALLQRAPAEQALSAAFQAFRRNGSSAAPGSSAELKEMRADPVLTEGVQAFVRNDDRA